VHKYRGPARGFLPFEKNRLYRSFLTKVAIPARAFPDLRYQLDRFGINKSTLFPDIEGLCAQIEWFHILLCDECADKKVLQPSPPLRPPTKHLSRTPRTQP